MTEEVLTIREGYTNDDSVESFQYIEIDCDNGTGNLNNETDLTITCQKIRVPGYILMLAI